MTDAQRVFAADVLRELLAHIVIKNIAADESTGHYVFSVSHAWTDGPMMYLVYEAPPSDVTWGLVRDTRESNIDRGPWLDLDEAVTYYYLLDLEENWPGRFSRKPGESDGIRWSGHLSAGLPERLSDVSEANRYRPPSTTTPSREDPNPPIVNEPRRYGNRT